MSSDYDNTPTAESAPTTGKSTQGNEEIILPWGRLYALRRTQNNRSFDLVHGSYTFGRGVGNDVVITKDWLPESKYVNISKVHFRIVREAGKPPVVVDLSKNGTFINNYLVGRNKRRILQNGDKIALGFVCLKIYSFKMLQSTEDRFLSPTLKKKYVSSHLLGTGACGEVRLVYELNTCERYAIKKIKKTSTIMNTEDLNHPTRIENEIKILQSLSHDCIVRVIEVEETQDCVFIVLEYLEGGELTDRILTIHPLSEATIKFLFYQIVQAVQYLHSCGITHRDLKPQNVLLVSHTAKTRVKVSDFGLSKLIVEDETFLRTVCGTPYYAAPEIWDETRPVYDKKVDIWSLGVVLYYMLEQDLPFKAKNTDDLKKLILSGNYSFKGTMWRETSKEVKSLLQKMLTVDPRKRISIDDVLKDDWFEKDIILQQDVAKLQNCPDDISSDEEEPPVKILHFS